MKTIDDLMQEIHELIDMLPDDMLEKAAGFILDVPDYPEDFAQDEIDAFEKAKEAFRESEVPNQDPRVRSIRERPAPFNDPAHSTRANLHVLAHAMSGELLDEAVAVLKSTALLNIPYEPTEEELAEFLAGVAEFERGESYRWEDIKRTDV